MTDLPPAFYAWLAPDSETGGMQLIYEPVGKDMIMPLVSTIERQAQLMAPRAHVAARARGQCAYLLKFTNPETISIVEP